MKKGMFLPVLALAVLTAACDDNDDMTGVDTTANVRFVNAISGVNSNLALTANGTIVGSPLAFGAMGTTCSTVNSGNATLAFGAANTGGTGISGTALSTQTQNFTAGGNYTIVATGTATNPSFVVLNNNSFTGTVGTGQTAVRFLNLVPTLSGGAASTLNVFTGTGTGTQQATNLNFGTTSNFVTLPSGSTTLSFRDAAGNTVFTNTGTGLNLATGTINTVAILPNAAGTGYQLISLNACPTTQA
jgi:hypothetical protein